MNIYGILPKKLTSICKKCIYNTWSLVVTRINKILIETIV